MYEAQGADELLFLDIGAREEGRSTLLEIIQSTAEQCFMPLTVGGAVDNLDDIYSLLRAGADKVCINTSAYNDPSLISLGAHTFGNQCIVVSIDYKKNHKGWNEVFVDSGRKGTGLKVTEWARKVYQRGAGEILLTSIDREGTRNGCDITTIEAVSQKVNCPVIASGGIGTLEHLVDAIVKGKAAAVAASSIFNFTDQSVIKCHSYMRHAGLDVRV